MNSLDFTKMVESRKKTIEMLEARIASLSAIHGYSASTVLQGTVKVARDRLAKVKRELAELEVLRQADDRQVDAFPAKPAKK